ncbi:MAG TPA: hypothetical protein VF783_25730 [Terriglobales bacterium]
MLIGTRQKNEVRADVHLIAVKQVRNPVLNSRGDIWRMYGIRLATAIAGDWFLQDFGVRVQVVIVVLANRDRSSPVKAADRTCTQNFARVPGRGITQASTCLA